MRIIKSIPSAQKHIARLNKKKKSIGLVATMGALHEGHLSLIRRSRRENDIVVLSIFINPKQFDPKEDFKTYPRQAKKDILLAKREKVDIMFYPSAEEMYPKNFLTDVHVEQLSEMLCGRNRPTHFLGVTTVVIKLLNIIMPRVLYLGQKDAQQAVILKKMINDLNVPVKVRMCPIIRESDGLAMSSRNKYLSKKQREEALILYCVLKQAKQGIKNGERKSKTIHQMIRDNIIKNSSGKIEYIACVNAQTLSSIKILNGKILIALAVKFGNTRLIDNILVNTE